MVGSALNLEYKSVVVCVPPGGSIRSLRTADRMLVCKVPRRTRQLSLYVTLYSEFLALCAVKGN